ncbi:MAG: hypothetical protein ACXWP5_02535 [Bdellovibrionota bacterium]
MKKFSKNKIALFAAIAFMGAVLSGCGSSGGGPVPPPPVGGIPGALGAGGCIPLPGMPMPGQVAQPATPISFTGTNVYFNGSSIRAGIIPGSQAFGQVMMGGAVTGGMYNRQGSDGTISMNITPAGAVPGAVPGATPYPTSPYPTSPYPTSPYPSYPYGGYGGYGTTGGATMTGYVQPSQAVLQDIMYQNGYSYGSGYPYGGTYGGGTYGSPFGGSYPYSPYPTSPYPTSPYPTAPAAPQICVSGVAVDLGIYNSTLYGGKVYLYLNNTQHGYIMYF